MPRLDNELPSEEAEAIDRHVEQCPACRGVRDAMRRTTRSCALFQERRQAPPASRVNRQLNGRLAIISSLTAVRPVAAAGFLLAVGLFQPWRRAPRRLVCCSRPMIWTVPGKGDLLLALAREPIEVLPPGAAVWKPLRPGEHLTPAAGYARRRMSVARFIQQTSRRFGSMARGAGPLSASGAWNWRRGR